MKPALRCSKSCRACEKVLPLTAWLGCAGSSRRRPSSSCGRWLGLRVCSSALKLACETERSFCTLCCSAFPGRRRHGEAIFSVDASFLTPLYCPPPDVFILLAFFGFDVSTSGQADVEDVVSADGLRSWAAELGESAARSLRGRLRKWRFRGDGPSLQHLAAELGVAFENVSRINLTERIVLALCPAAAPSASSDIKYHVWRSLRAAHEAGADTVAAVVLAAPDIFEDVNLRRSAAAYSLDITATVFCDRHLSSAAEQQLLAELLLKALPHWPEVDVALAPEVSTAWEAAVASLRGVRVPSLSAPLQQCLLAAVLEDRADQRAGERQKLSFYHFSRKHREGFFRAEPPDTTT
ncbi:unnamed protein product [Symbiodinium natans]|uniref:Uncharacterized protein n=1 Tax=Symbiodinium natans TaxID=878477 RepID=A0A812MU89_9DINO|nr:unnamed protein product [Symbiodinium natans]